MIETFGEVLDKWSYAGILVTDFLKAFDWINLELLIGKLQAFGFSLKSLKFIQSYLFDSVQMVKINSSFSDSGNVESGVSQESIPWPPLFNISIFALLLDGIDIGLVDYTMAQPHMYMFLKMEKAIKLLEENIDKLFDWFSDNF